MSKYRRAAKIDANQNSIVDELRSMGISVEVGYDDILVGWRGRTYWFEVKDPATCFKADGITFKKGAIKESQTKLRATFQGSYDIVWSTEMILQRIGI